MKIADVVKGMTDEELGELGTALGHEALPRLRRVLDGLNSTHDSKQRSDLFDDCWTSFYLSRTTESVAERVMHSADMRQLQMT